MFNFADYMVQDRIKEKKKKEGERQMETAAIDISISMYQFNRVACIHGAVDVFYHSLDRELHDFYLTRNA